ncbi:hypothetical protein [Paenarthrobacter ilicis]|uniref:Uncharacterized protein n=1 Tax=Paenarthrobacter ilicis TaxID=43665 RepID=A0ABX0THR3_9MICC|nr:hypothetical protein [Paenarthrobacter ilicis]MBM7791960.1 hypothetical protein [Paenarthrobacter ilicis]NIJ01415.1 hypothetical protein [Paenarthrobacter ilicis]
MAEKPTSMVLGVMAVAVFAGLGRMVVQKMLADKAAREKLVTAPLDAETRAKISQALRTPQE